MFQTVILEIPHAKQRNHEVSNSTGVRIGKKVGIVNKLCSMLMHVFVRIGVEWRNLTVDILAYRAILALNFVKKAPLILISIEIICGNILI